MLRATERASVPPHRARKEQGKVVGTVGTILPNEPMSLVLQGVELFPHIVILIGYKVGTMGTEGRIFKLFPPVPNTLMGLWVQTNPVMGRVSGHYSLVPTVPTVFLRHIEQTAGQDHTLTATGGCIEIDQRTTQVGDNAAPPTSTKRGGLSG
jgi:hypothetical protein